MQKRETADFTPQYMQMGENVPPPFSFILLFINSFIIMQSKFDLAKVVSVEIPDTLKQNNREETDGREPQTGYRIVISFSSSDDLSDKEKELLSKVTNDTIREKMKANILANRTQIRYSGVFNADDLQLDLGNGKVFKTPKGGLTDEQQDNLLKKIVSYYESIGNENIFTVMTEEISALTKGTEKETDYLLYKNANGEQIEIREQSRIFFGVFTDEESAFNMLKRSILRRIESGDLELPDTAKPVTADNETAADDLGL